MNNDTNPGFRAFIAIVVFVISAWIATGYFLHNYPNRGTFGDMFGAVNALFSGLAFAGVIYAILLQRKELSLQRSELELTRGELRGQIKQMEAQNVTLRKQSFENTFFQLIRLQNEITSSINIQVNTNFSINGRDCFNNFMEKYKLLWRKELSEHKGNDDLDRINKTYLTFYPGVQADIGHYFRSLYNVIKLIDTSEVEDKRLYTNLVRAQLSSLELTLLFYNSLSNMGNMKFKPLIEKYALLKTLPRNQLIDNSHLSYYEHGAYGDEQPTG